MHAFISLNVGGIFLFADLSPFLTDLTWDDEGALFDELVSKYALIFTPGGACHAPHPGYFRICYAYYADSNAAINRCIAQLAALCRSKSKVA